MKWRRCYCRIWETTAFIIGVILFMLLVGGFCWGLVMVIDKTAGEAHRAEKIRKLDREAEHIAKHLVSTLYHKRTYLLSKAESSLKNISNTAILAV